MANQKNLETIAELNCATSSPAWNAFCIATMDALGCNTISHMIDNDEWLPYWRVWKFGMRYALQTVGAATSKSIDQVLKSVEC